MTPQHLRQLAARTGLDGIAESLKEGADAIERRDAVIKLLEGDLADSHDRNATLAADLKNAHEFIHLDRQILAGCPTVPDKSVEPGCALLGTDERQLLVDGYWYWVRHDQGVWLDPIEAPARYQANVACFYSVEFAGIPSREVTVLGPALRAQPADLTQDALMRRIQASPFRDDKALANLVERLLARVAELEAQSSASTDELI